MKTVQISEQELKDLLIRERNKGRKEAFLAMSENGDAVKCPWCNTTSLVKHIRDGRCCYCHRLYPPGTMSHQGRVYK